ncbi:MAG: universal stress protein [Acidobacteria bacterium]|nr:universal stress protein [Acidobacteriota bacterium]
MSPFKQILCPVDFSDFSRRAVRVARGLARDFQAQVDLIHVLDMRAFSPAEAALAPRIQAANRRRVEEQMTTLAQEEGIDREHVCISEGIPHSSIVRQAEEIGADLLVMGTHGISGFERLLLGSVTEKVLHKIHTPLLAVSQNVPDTVVAAEAEGRLGTILVATDLGTDTMDTVEYAFALGTRYGARIVMLHVVPPPMAFFGPMEAPWPGAVDMDGLAERLEKDGLKRMEALVPAELGEGCPVEFLVRHGNPSAVILDTASAHHADLVVVGAHGHGSSDLGWVGSTCHRVLRAAKCPVLAVRPRS